MPIVGPLRVKLSEAGAKIAGIGDISALLGRFIDAEGQSVIIDLDAFSSPRAFADAARS